MNVILLRRGDCERAAVASLILLMFFACLSFGFTVFVRARHMFGRISPLLSRLFCTSLATQTAQWSSWIAGFALLYPNMFSTSLLTAFFQKQCNQYFPLSEFTNNFFCQTHLHGATFLEQYSLTETCMALLLVCFIKAKDISSVIIIFHALERPTLNNKKKTLS